MATSGDLTDAISQALGVPFETVREHLRNIRRAPNTITFSGYGRSAAAMTPRDAVRLLLAVAGSQFVKDSKVTLDAFKKLQPVREVQRRPRPPERPLILEEHLVRLMERLIVSRDNLPTAYTRNGTKEKHAAIALTLISGLSKDAQELPRAAIARWYPDGGSSAISFATPGWTTPVISEVEYALALPKVGLVTTRHVTTWAFAEIALSLIPDTGE